MKRVLLLKYPPAGEEDEKVYEVHNFGVATASAHVPSRAITCHHVPSRAITCHHVPSRAITSMPRATLRHT